jgi:acetoacetyl-CoA reductase
MGSLDGKVALVTGASRGIGRAIALELAGAGARVAVNYRTGEAEARAVAAEIAGLRAVSARSGRDGESQARAIADEVATRVGTMPTIQIGADTSGAAYQEDVLLIKADISEPEEARQMIAKVIEKWGTLDILVNNAGITRDKVVRKLRDDEWLAVINTNLNGAFYCTSAAVPAMVEQKYGRIVNIASLTGQVGNVGQSNYAAAKGGMIAFTKSIALELAKFNITVNAVCPGFTATDMLASVPENILDQIRSKIPLGRFCEPREIAKAVYFLVADGDYITGQQISVNGGIHM